MGVMVGFHAKHDSSSGGEECEASGSTTVWLRFTERRLLPTLPWYRKHSWEHAKHADTLTWQSKHTWQRWTADQAHSSDRVLAAGPDDYGKNHNRDYLEGYCNPGDKTRLFTERLLNHENTVTLNLKWTEKIMSSQNLKWWFLFCFVLGNYLKKVIIIMSI